MSIVAPTRSTAPRIVAGTATAVLAVVLGVFGSIGVLVGPLALEYGASRGRTVLLFAAALCVYSLAAPAAGRAVDRHGPRPLLTVAAAGMAGGLLSVALAPVVEVAVVGYGIGVGLAGACTWVATTTAVSAAFAHRRAAALGLLTAGPAAGGVMFAPVMTALTQAQGPRTTATVLAVVGAAACALAATVLHDRPAVAQRGTDQVTDTPSPTPDLRRFFAAALLMGLVVFLPLVHVASYAVDAGLSPAEGAAVLAVVSAVSATVRLGAGWLATPRILPILFSGSHLLVAAAFAVWALGGRSTTLPVLMVVGVLFGAGYGAWLALGPAVLAESCEPDRRGRALGRLAAVVGTGGVLGPVLAAPLLASAPGTTLGACAVLALAAVGLLTRRNA